MKERVKRAAFVAGNVLAVAALILGILYGLWRIGVWKIPDFITELWRGPDDTITVIPGDEGKIYEALMGNGTDETIQITPDLNQDNINALIEEMKVRRQFYCEAQSTLYAGDGRLTNHLVIRYHDGSYRIEQSDDSGRLIKVVADNGKTATVRNLDSHGNSKTAEFPSGTVDLFAQAGMPNGKEFLDLPEAQPSAQDARRTFTLIESEEYGNLLYLAYERTKGDYSQYEVCYYSLDYGIAVRYESYENGVMTYLYEIVSLSDLSQISEDLFVA